jgi:hypothetical protein
VVNFAVGAGEHLPLTLRWKILEVWGDKDLQPGQEIVIDITINSNPGPARFQEGRTYFLALNKHEGKYYLLPWAVDGVFPIEPQDGAVMVRDGMKVPAEQMGPYITSLQKALYQGLGPSPEELPRWQGLLKSDTFVDSCVLSAGVKKI